MGLLESLGLGDMLKSLLGQAQSAGLPAVINNVLAQTQYRDLNGLVAALEKGAGSAPKCNPGSAPGPTRRLPRNN